MTVFARMVPQGCGCDSISEVGGLISIDEALGLISQRTMPLHHIEEVPLAASVGRVLAEPVCAGADVPPFDNSAMDGYALNTADLTGSGPWRLPVCERVAAGYAPSQSLRMGTAAQVFTGAPIPKDADAVVMQEAIQCLDGEIVVSEKVRPRANVRFAGEDITAGAAVVPTGRRITARDIAAGAAAGSSTVRVRGRVRVALVVTGDEVHAPGQQLHRAGIWDVNTPMLSAVIATSGLDLVCIETGKDNRDALRRQLSGLAQRVDLIVTTGGISVGEEDHVKPAVKELGGTMVFSGVAMKPGKPVSFGRLGTTHWLGLPGNPLSAFVTWQLFGTALCGALTGDTKSSGNRRHVVLSRALQHKSGRCELRLAEICGFDGLGREIVHFDNATHSGRVVRLPSANGVILIPSEADDLPEGALVEFQPFCN